MMAAVVA